MPTEARKTVVRTMRFQMTSSIQQSGMGILPMILPGGKTQTTGKMPVPHPRKKRDRHVFARSRRVRRCGLASLASTFARAQKSFLVHPGYGYFSPDPQHGEASGATKWRSHVAVGEAKQAHGRMGKQTSHEVVIASGRVFYHRFAAPRFGTGDRGLASLTHGYMLSRLRRSIRVNPPALLVRIHPVPPFHRLMSPGRHARSLNCWVAPFRGLPQATNSAGGC